MPPGSRKSPVHSALVAPVVAVEAAMAAEASASIAEAKALRSVAEKAARAAEGKAAAAQGAQRDKLQAEAIAMAAAADSIGIPVIPRLVADDVGPEKAAAMMAEQGGRLAILSAEGGPFVTLAGRYSKEPNLDFFLKSWSGDPIRVDRIGRPPDHIPCPALTLGLAVQPEVLKQIFGRPGFDGRGLLARVLYSMPPNMVGHRQVRTVPVPPDVSGHYAATIGTLVRTYAEWAADPAPFRLTPGASEMVYQAQERIEPRLDPHGGDLGHIPEWAAKLVGTTARIAGLLHAAEHLGDGYRYPVGEDTMARALAAGEYFTAHALAVFDFMGADPAMEDAKAVHGWIRRKREVPFTRRDVQRALRTNKRFQKVEDTEPALALLAGSGWIRPVKTADPGKQGGRPPSPAFDAHPVTPAAGWLVHLTEPPQLTQPRFCQLCQFCQVHMTASGAGLCGEVLSVLSVLSGVTGAKADGRAGGWLNGPEHLHTGGPARHARGQLARMATYGRWVRVGWCAPAGPRCDAERVNVDVRVRGRDGRLYPARAATDAERDRLVYLIHRLRCGGRLSIREVRRRLEEDHGIRRSVGAVMRDVQVYRCPVCQEPG